MNKTYTPLHVHSDASLLDGYGSPKTIAKRITEIGSEGCAITEHGNVASAIQFLKAMEKSKKKPVLGCELYISNQHASDQIPENRKLTHLPVLAKNTNGWKQLLKIIHASNLPDHYYYKPRLSLDQLSEFLDGNIIGFSGHLGSHIARTVEEYGEKAATQAALNMQEMFGKGNFYLEVQLMDSVNTPAQIQLTETIRSISKTTGIPIIATPDAHYQHKEDVENQRVLLCSNMHVTMREANHPDFQLRTFFRSDNFHIPSYEEMIAYGHTEEELENTNKVLAQVEKYDILRDPQLPQFPCPNDQTPDEYLRELCRGGWKELIQNVIPREKHPEYTERIKEELDILQGAGLSSYFLIVRDILQHVKDQGNLIGPGRGSSSGCLVSYLIGITQIDPIEYGLLFSRFFSDARKGSLPDIDVDIPINTRETTIEYIREKYGIDKVGQMITFQTMQGAKALSEVLRANESVPFEEVKRITKSLPEKAKIAGELQKMKDSGREPSIIRWVLENQPEKLSEWCSLKDDKLIGLLAKDFEQAMRLEGTKAAQSRHAAGVVIGTTPLEEICPFIYDTKNKNMIAGWEMDDLEAVGLVKLDILGLAALDKVMKIVELLHRQDNHTFDGNIRNITLKDNPTWDLISSGKNLGVFQLESSFACQFAKKLKPHNMEHLAALTAILRPGCISGDTPIYISEYYRNDSPNNQKFIIKTMKQLYEEHTRNHHLLHNSIMSYDETNHNIVSNKIVNIWNSGTKTVHKINFSKHASNKINNNPKYNIKCTSEHKFYVYSKGWTQLQHIQPGDRFLILGHGEGRKLLPKRKFTEHHRQFRDICFRNYKYQCVMCDWNEGSLDVNHLEENRTINNKPENLCFLCPNHHRMYTEKSITKTKLIVNRDKLRLPQHEKLIWATFIDYETVGQQDTYDIEVEEPHNSFIAGGMIVHNSSQAKKEDGKTIAEHYIDRKNGKEEITYLHKSLEPILKDTYGELIYQESAMRVAMDIASMSSVDTDKYIRKGIGKKLADIIAEAKSLFLDGCKKTNIVDKEIAEEIFGWIESAQRYSFNASHSYSYGHVSYLTAYAKTHFPKEFFTSYLSFAHEKPKPKDEIYSLVNDARSMDIFVQPPSIEHCNRNFDLIDGKIYFGLTDIQHVGKTVLDKLITISHEDKTQTRIGPRKHWPWLGFLIHVSPRLNSRSCQSLINTGACDYFKVPRKRMEFEYSIYCELTKKEQTWVEDNIMDFRLRLEDILINMATLPTGKKGACANKNRHKKVLSLIESLQNPPHELIDTQDQISKLEYKLLGISLTANSLGGCNGLYRANCSCQEWGEGSRESGTLAVKIERVKTNTIKRGINKGEDMAFLTVGDDSGILDSVVAFADTWAEHRNIIEEGNRLLLTGKKSRDKDSFIVENVEQLS